MANGPKVFALTLLVTEDWGVDMFCKLTSTGYVEAFTRTQSRGQSTRKPWQKANRTFNLIGNKIGYWVRLGQN